MLGLKIIIKFIHIIPLTYSHLKNYIKTTYRLTAECLVNAHFIPFETKITNKVRANKLLPWCLGNSYFQPRFQFRKYVSKTYLYVYSINVIFIKVIIYDNVNLYINDYNICIIQQLKAVICFNWFDCMLSRIHDC